MSRLLAASAALLGGATATSSALNMSKFIAVGDVGTSAFTLLLVDFGNASSPYTSLGKGLPGWLLVQGDATTLDATNGTYFAVLNPTSGGVVDYSSSTLFGFDAGTGGVTLSHPFPVNYTMGALAFHPRLRLVVGLCGSLLTNGSVQGYCGFDPATRSLSLLRDFGWSLMYDPDTRALDPSRELYYHRLYNATWMPDFFVTLNATTGEVVQSCQFSSPEFSGTRVDVATGGVFSVCNADAGLDLCGVDPATGAFTPLNVFDRERESSELFAATCAVDPLHSLFLLTATLARDGTHTRVVDIRKGSSTYGSIVANLTVPAQWFPSNYHPLGVLDAAPAAKQPPPPVRPLLPAVPSWSAPLGNWSLPLGGWPVVPNATWAEVFMSTPALCSYNHAPMITYGGEEGERRTFLVTWKNNCVGEDKPGQRVLYSQSADGVRWTPTDGTNVMFPNMSTEDNPAALFAEPPVWLNGRLYAAASPTQFCLYPDQYSPTLLLRRVYTNGTGVLGPPFWASHPPPPAFAQASALRGVLNLTSMDAGTQADVALLTPNATLLPCAVPGSPTTKCEACAGGCQPWAAAGANVSNERAHYDVPGGGGADVLLYRSSLPVLYAAPRPAGPAAAWAPPVPTTIPNDYSNLNAGVLPDGRVYLLSNALPADTRSPVAGRDPLTVALSTDGADFSSCAVAMSCFLLPGGQCAPRNRDVHPRGGGEGEGLGGRTNGASYPQGVAVGPLGALFVVGANNKEDIWVARLPLSGL